jgi:hypothetical protein
MNKYNRPDELRVIRENLNVAKIKSAIGMITGGAGAAACKF